MAGTSPERRARTVALVGLTWQVLLALALLILWVWAGKAASLAAACRLATGGVGIWFALVLIYHQRKLVGDEALETELLRRQRAGEGGSDALFGDDEQLLLARRRLHWMYRWALPAFTFVIVLGLALMSLVGWGWAIGASPDADLWPEVAHPDIAFAFVVGLGFVSFLLGRYAQGMARSTEWRMLRAGASYLMGNTLACIAVAVTLGLVHFELASPERVLASVLRILMLVLAAEFLMNYVLDLYRPRTPDQEPRVAFDSRLLGILSEPGGIARSIAEAINYQFGFEVSSTWFYKLLQRAIVPLICFAVLTMILASTLVIVEADEVAIIERFGRPLTRAGAEAGDMSKIKLFGPGLHVKWPWPIDRAYPVAGKRLRLVTIGNMEGEPEPGREDKPLLWTEEHKFEPEVNVIVATARLAEEPATTPQESTTQPAEQAGGRAVAVSLLRISVPMQYVITDPVAWLTRYQNPVAVIEAFGNRELIRHGAGLDIDRVMGEGRREMAAALKAETQSRLDSAGVGVQLTFVGAQGVHPPAETASEFEAVVGAEQEKISAERAAQAEYNKILSNVCGDVRKAEALADAILRRTDSASGSDDKPRASPAGIEVAQARLDLLFEEISGQAAEIAEKARADMFERENQARAARDAFRQELLAYRAAPKVYRTRKYLEALADGLAGVRKYIIAAEREGQPSVYHLNLQDTLGIGFDEALSKEQP